MKTTIMHLMSLFLILAFSASCGKGGESGGSSKSSNNVNSGLSTSGEAAKKNLIAWYNTKSEGSIPSLSNGLLLKLVYRFEKTISTSNGCNQQPISIGGFNLGNLNFCINSNTGGNGTQTQEFVTMLASGDKKVGNANLAAAMAPVLTLGANGLNLVGITQKPSPAGSGSAYTLTFVSSTPVNNTTPKTVLYIIDTAYNSRVNPVVTVDGINGKQIIYAGTQY